MKLYFTLYLLILVFDDKQQIKTNNLLPFLKQQSSVKNTSGKVDIILHVTRKLCYRKDDRCALYKWIE